MIRRVAIDPAILSTADRLTLLGRDVRISRGRQLQPLVAGWRQSVAERAASIGDDRERIRFRERLKSLYERPGAVASSTLAPDRSWDLEVLVQRRQLDVVATDRRLPVPHRATFDDIEAERPPWAATAIVETTKDPEDLSMYLSPLLAISEEAWLVDGYIATCAERLARLLEACARKHPGDSRLKRLTVVTRREADRTGSTTEHMRRILDAVVARVPALRALTAELEISFWATSGRLRMHERLLITNVGAVRSDYGFDDNPKGARTSLALLDEGSWHLNRVRYDRAHPDHPNVDRLTLVAVESLAVR